MSEAERWDSLLWESTDSSGEPILRNLYGIRDPAHLARREYRETALRSVEIQCGMVEIPHTADLAEWLAIHEHLLGNVYPWAGQLRDVELVKIDQRFLSPKHLSGFIADVTGRLRSVDWARLNKYEFVNNVAHALMDLNWAHPFREGNGRSTRLFLDRLIAEARWELDYTRGKDYLWKIAHYDAHPYSANRPVDYSPLLPVVAERTVERTSAPVKVSHLGDGRIAVELDATPETAMIGHHIGDTIEAAGLTSEISTAAASVQPPAQLIAPDSHAQLGHAPDVAE